MKQQSSSASTNRYISLCISKSRNKLGPSYKHWHRTVYAIHALLFTEMRCNCSASLGRQQHLLRVSRIAAISLLFLCQKISHTSPSQSLLSLGLCVTIFCSCRRRRRRTINRTSNAPIYCANLRLIIFFVVFRGNSVCSFNYSLRFEFY